MRHSVRTPALRSSSRLLFALVTLALAGCAGSAGSGVATVSGAAAELPTSPGENRATCERPIRYPAIVPRTVEDLIARSDAILVGTVGEQRVTTFNERPTEPHRPLPPPTTWTSPDGVNVQRPPDNDGERGELPPTTFDLGTDSSVRIDRLLSGSVGDTTQFTLRNLGDGRLSCDPMDPIAESGRQYVFFLVRAGWEESQPANGVWFANGGLTGRYRLDDGNRLRADRSPSAIYLADLDGMTLPDLERSMSR